jgi:hypothetical protein
VLAHEGLVVHDALRTRRMGADACDAVHRGRSFETLPWDPSHIQDHPRVRGRPAREDHGERGSPDLVSSSFDVLADIRIEATRDQLARLAIAARRLTGMRAIPGGQHLPASIQETRPVRMRPSAGTFWIEQADLLALAWGDVGVCLRPPFLDLGSAR